MLQDLQAAAEHHEQAAAAAERQSRSAQQHLDQLSSQADAAKAQLSEIQAALLAAARQQQQQPFGPMLSRLSTPGGAAAAGLFGNVSGFSGGAGLGLGLLGSSHDALMQQQQHSQLAACVVQLQAEQERLQLAVVQAQARQRASEQRALDAEQACSDLQARLGAARAQQQAASLHAHDDVGASGTALKWRLKVGIWAAGRGPPLHLAFVLYSAQRSAVLTQ